MVPAATVEFYNVVVFFHVIAVVIGLGPTFAYAAFLATAQREGGAAIPVIGRTIVFWDRTVNTIAMTLVLLSGLYLVSDGPYGIGTFFVSWGFVAIIFLLGITHAFFIPKTKQAIELAERDLAKANGDLSAEFNTLSAQISKVGMTAGIVIILTVYVMTAKPF